VNPGASRSCIGPDIGGCAWRGRSGLCDWLDSAEPPCAGRPNGRALRNRWRSRSVLDHNSCRSGLGLGNVHRQRSGRRPRRSPCDDRHDVDANPLRRHNAPAIVPRTMQGAAPGKLPRSVGAAPGCNFAGNTNADIAALSVLRPPSPPRLSEWPAKCQSASKVDPIWSVTCRPGNNSIRPDGKTVHSPADRRRQTGSSSPPAPGGA
jgi:hypothetical protein